MQASLTSSSTASQKAFGTHFAFTILKRERYTTGADFHKLQLQLQQQHDVQEQQRLLTRNLQQESRQLSNKMDDMIAMFREFSAQRTSQSPAPTPPNVLVPVTTTQGLAPAQPLPPVYPLSQPRESSVENLLNLSPAPSGRCVNFACSLTVAGGTA